MKSVTLLLAFLLCGTLLAQDCQPGTANFDLHANNVSARILNRGALFTDGQAGRFLPNPQPNTQNPTTIFAAGLWFGGLDPAQNLKIDAVTYGDGFIAGPLNPDTGAPDPLTCSDWDRIFTVRGDRVAEFLNQLPALANDPDAAIAQFPEIMGWPAAGNPYFEAVNGFPLPANQSFGLAPFFDFTGTAKYNPLGGDYPAVIGNTAYVLPTEITWCVYHTVGSGNPANALSTPAEIQQTAWAFDCAEPEVLSNTVFTTHRIRYFGTEPMDSVQLAIWVDSQIGNCGPTSDYLGSIPQLNAFYATSNRLDDNCMPDIPAFAGVPPIQSVTFLNREMDRFIYYNNPNIGLPHLATVDPTTPIEYFRYLTGHWRDGQPLVYENTGYPVSLNTLTNYAFPDNPANPAGWSICTADLPALADRRGLAATKIGHWEPYDVTRLTTAWAFHDGAEPLCDLTTTYDDIEMIRYLYLNSFETVCSPLTAIPVRITESPVVRVFPNPASLQLNIEFEKEIPEIIRLYNANGQMIQSQNLSENSLRIPVQHLPNGLYTLECLFDKTVIVKKILLQPGK